MPPPGWPPYRPCADASLAVTSAAASVMAVAIEVVILLDEGRMTVSAAVGRMVIDEKTRPGKIWPGGSFIAICLQVGVRGVADVDVAVQHRAPLPARAVVATDVEMAVTPVVAVVVMAVVVMVVMAAMMMATPVPMAGGRIARGGERGNRQRHGGDSGSKDSTRHFNFSWG
jgi:hypothetical protein